MRVRGFGCCLAFVAVLAGLSLTPAPALATFHLIEIRELYPGSSANPEAEYVELQMYAAGQNHVAGHSLDFFDASGAMVSTATFGADVPNGANQSTLLAASPAGESQLGVVADTGMPGGSLDPSGGAVCWESLDCVSWGSFHGSTLSPTGSPADPLGIPDGMALRRTIAPGCPTLLEAADDRNDSATDFSDVFPAPRPNSAAPAERACVAQGQVEGEYPPAGGGATGGGGRGGTPQTRLGHRPRRRTSDRTPTFRFASNQPRARFLCKLDRRPYRGCRSPFTTPPLRLGPHVFRVAAKVPGEAADSSPALWRFTVVRQRLPRAGSH